MVDSPERRDPMGYYARLGVPPTATAERIKLAFRQQAKHVHPDRNVGAGAKDAFQRLNEAYQVLSDPAARAQYDARALERPASPPPPPSPSASARPAAGRFRPVPASAAGAAEGVVVPVACSGCGAITAQPRYTIYWRVVSFVVGTLRQPVQGVFCRRCADRRGLAASATTWALGWWGVPWGPFWTVKALWCNLRGGERPADLNASLLRQQALYFWATGKPALARAALDQATRLVERPELRQKLEKMRLLIGEGGREHLVDRWRPAASWAFYLHLLPVVVVTAGMLALAGHLVLTVGPPPTLATGPAATVGATPPVHPPSATTAAPLPSSPPSRSADGASPPERWHVKAGTLTLRDGPGAGHLAIGRLHQSDSVEIIARIDGWVRVRTALGQVGFVAQDFLAAGAGDDEE